jgi:NADH:ubiquinone reductase (H+-translocating)
MLMPFYVPGRDRLRVVIVGGGYSGLGALVALREHRPDAEIVLVDPRSHHCKITHLHKSFRQPLADFFVPFRALERRFGIRHVQAGLPMNETLLKQWNGDRMLAVGEEVLEFDYLLVATGAERRGTEKTDGMIDLDDFTAQSGIELLEKQLGNFGERCLTVVGGGATGVQYLFEIAHFLRERRISCRLRLVDAEPAPLRQFPSKLGRYVEARIGDLEIDYRPNCFFRSQASGQVVLEGRETGELIELPSDLSLLFTGKSPTPRFEADLFGHIVVNAKTLDAVFTAGDCSHYRGPGSNSATAQSAVRKGRLAARNMLRASGPFKVPEPYLHRDLGYVISMGPRDAVGWVALQRNVVAGVAADLVKDLVEAQYNLLLDGIDTYLL